MRLLKFINPAAVAAVILVTTGICHAQATLTTLYTFTGGDNGSGPYAGPVMGANGVLYGTTLGGTTGNGTVNELVPPTAAGAAWTQTVIYEFAGPPADGFFPLGPLAVSKHGVLYGTTSYGGTYGPSFRSGAVFELTPPSSAGGAWSERIIHNFGARDDGASPESGVVIGADGKLYGTTSAGGPFGQGLGFGTVFSMSPPAAPGGDWTETVIYEFGPHDNGAGGLPCGGLAMDGDGVLYGTTDRSRAAGYYGSVFALQPPAQAGSAWTEQVLHRFTGAPADGAEPCGTLTIGQNGVLYGTTQKGGSFDYGTVFAVTPPVVAGGTWSETILHSYGGSGDGEYLAGSLIPGPAGVLYGTTGSSACLQQPPGEGTVFALQPPGVAGGPWINMILYRFVDGFPPNPSLFPGPGGVLYGTTSGLCSAANNGTVFSLIP